MSPTPLRLLVLVVAIAGVTCGGTTPSNEGSGGHDAGVSGTGGVGETLGGTGGQATGGAANLAEVPGVWVGTTTGTTSESGESVPFEQLTVLHLCPDGRARKESTVSIDGRESASSCRGSYEVTDTAVNVHGRIEDCTFTNAEPRDMEEWRLYLLREGSYLYYINTLFKPESSAPDCS